jgi:hypothetical protein
MTEYIWETFNSIFKTVYSQGLRVEDLEARLVALEQDKFPKLEAQVAQLELQVSELRHKMGLTEVDELQERATADR